ncbi:lipopolysaccharide biosynthesis protein [Stappia taiwanensis]|uniref:Lipopolysaccharide biosynthesis protein n=1 Tax=Stappia taiwanensis TaxID=992267 RepID=A0A838XK93_9HYPH|nr:exopolysaccharide transport family protein [Stappia taiwanensis]MBA4611749.1 lipopolysaccharide biosynthesis protein [Stappia taiwanensis]GGE97092.1 succinoglycan biosynthesis transporter ExoP [Stappia taiwanensis]
MVIHSISNIVSGDQFDGLRSGEGEYVTFQDIWAFFKRHLRLLALTTVVSATLGLVYLHYTPPLYSAVAQLVMDPQQAKIASQDVSTGTIIIESAEIASQVQIVKSEAIARSVIEELDLLNDPEVRTSTSLRATVRRWLRMGLAAVGLSGSRSGQGEASDTGMGLAEAEAQRASAEDDLMRQTMAGFLSRVEVRRVGQSYVLEISYRSTDPRKAAKIANTIAHTYIRSGMDDRANSARRGASWLQERLVEIGQNAREAQTAVEEFRARNGITQIGTASPLDQQQILETNSQLLAAHAETAMAEARYETLSRLVSGESADEPIEDPGTNAQVQKLRDEIRLATSRREMLKARYTDDSPAVVAVEAEIARLEREIRAEFVRMQNVYRSELEIARAREASIRADLMASKSQNVEKNLARIELAELESRAATYRRMYESFLQQLIGALQNQSFPLGTARIVTAAATPLMAESPKTSVIMALSVMLGFAGGIFIAAWRETMDRRLSAGSASRRELGLVPLGFVPELPTRTFVIPALQRLPLRRRGRVFDPWCAVLNAPYSEFAEALRSIKAPIGVGTATSSDKGKAIGITSVDQAEGKTTIALNLAQVYLNEGVSTVIVDADFLTGTLSLLATKHGADYGLEARVSSPLGERGERPKLVLAQSHGNAAAAASEMASSSAPEPDIVGSPVLPVLTSSRIRGERPVRYSYGHLVSLRQWLDDLRKTYQVVIVDMDAFGQSADARSICTMVDGVAVVVDDARKMTIDRLSEALSLFGKTQISLIGIVFNRSRKERRPVRARRSNRREKGL